MSESTLYPGLNDLTDALEALPQEIVRYFTLLKEIDAKCVNTSPKLNASITEFLCGKPQPRAVDQERTDEESPSSPKETPLESINLLFRELMPALEEKMHVSSIANEALNKILSRIETAYEVVLKTNEIPQAVRLGNNNHPAMHLHHQMMRQVDKGTKSVQAAKSESRREAIAAKKANANESEYESSSTKGRRRGKVATPVVEPAQLATKRFASRTTTPAQEHAELVVDGRKKRKKEEEEVEFQKFNDQGEAVYCYCGQVSYGEMIGCDGKDCVREWFHLPCIGMEQLPRGKWYCNECKEKMKRVRRA